VRKRKRERVKGKGFSTIECFTHRTMCLPSKLTNGICGPTSHSSLFSAWLMPNGYYFFTRVNHNLSGEISWYDRPTSPYTKTLTENSH